MQSAHVNGEVLESQSRLGNARAPARWIECLERRRLVHRTVRDVALIGVLGGEGVGPEVIGAALEVLRSVAEVSGLRVELRHGGAIGRDAERECGECLPADVVRFCSEVFDGGGAVLHGPGGGRFVYELRRRLDLFFKISPLRICNGVTDPSRIKPEATRGLDILVARENSGGVYQGEWDLGAQADHRSDDSLGVPEDDDRPAIHRFGYSRRQVRRFLRASARLAAGRRGEMTVVWKESGVPTISRLWRECAEEAAAEHRVRVSMVDIDLMAYRLVQEAPIFDVIAAPNLFGDVLGDLGAVLLGSRGASYSGNFDERGDGVYQTNHGAAYDLAGSDRANPAGQIFALAMMLRESFGRMREAEAIEQAVRQVWREGWRTDDVMAPGMRRVGTSEFGRLIAERAAMNMEHAPVIECAARDTPVSSEAP